MVLLVVVAVEGGGEGKVRRGVGWREGGGGGGVEDGANSSTSG